MSDITRIESGPRMSQCVVHNGIAYLAGQVGAEGASVKEQTETVLASVDRLLALAGTNKTKLLTAQIWVADMSDFAEMNAVWTDGSPKVMRLPAGLANPSSPQLASRWRLS